MIRIRLHITLSARLIIVSAVCVLMGSGCTTTPASRGLDFGVWHWADHASLFPEDASSRVHVLHAKVPFYVDGDRRFWGVLADHPGVLIEWDGDHLAPHPMPTVYLQSDLNSLYADGMERIWVIPKNIDRSVLIFAPEDESWKIYNSLPAVVQRETAGRPDVRFRAVGFLDQWIGADELLSENWIPVEEWHGRLHSDHIAAFKQDWEADFDFSVLRDNIGFFWILAPDRVLKTGFGHTAELWDSGVDRLLPAGHEWTRVILDAHGNAFLEARVPGRTGRTYVVIRPPEGAPAMSLDYERVAEDELVVRFVPESGDADFCLWRLDRGEWKSVRASEALHLRWLPPGLRLLEVVPVNAALTMSPIPTGLSIEIDVDPIAQMTAMIDALSDESTRRAAGQALLSRDRHMAAPALERALETAEGDHRDTIRSVLQRMRGE